MHLHIPRPYARNAETACVKSEASCSGYSGPALAPTSSTLAVSARCSASGTFMLGFCRSLGLGLRAEEVEGWRGGGFELDS